MRPYVVDEVRSPDLDVLDKKKPEELSEAVSSDTARELRKMMDNVVDRGTAGVARIPGVAVGAKTGTAEGCKDCRSEEHTSELQSLMRISYAVFCLQKKKNNTPNLTHQTDTEQNK